MSRTGHKPIVLIVRDGWGANPHPRWNHANAVYLARKPVDDKLRATYPHVLIKTSGNDVGLPEGVMGNSEVGHQNIGAGRIVEQEIMRITGRIRDGKLFENPVLVGAFDHAVKARGRVHLMGLCSDGRVHSDLEHLYGLMNMVAMRGFPRNRVHLHAFMDGRDTAPNAGVHFVDAIEVKCREFGIPPIATVVGRYYAMDRDNRWDRVEKAYLLLARGEGLRFPTAREAVLNYYAHPSEPNRTGDEFIVPSVTAPPGAEPAGIRDGDSVIFFNFRGDRPRELCDAFTADEFPYDGKSSDGAAMRIGFDRGKKLKLYFATMTEYEKGLPVHVAFGKPDRMADILGAYVSQQGLAQFRCAETEKYPHVTFFFNDYRDEPFPGEKRTLVPSPRDVTTYDQKPEMAAFQVAEAVLRRIALGKDDLMVVNFANGDMVGHTGNLQAAIRAVEVVDECVGKLTSAVLEKGGGLIVTADHGNCEQMVDPVNGGAHTAHTTFDVDLILVDDRFRTRTLRTGGRLADIAPTLVQMLQLSKPPAMTGKTLIEPP